MIGLRAARTCLLLLASILAGCAAVELPAPPAEATTADRVRRLAAILDYVAADYPAAVDAGVVANPLEYDEQVTFLADAAALAADLPSGQVVRTDWLVAIDEVLAAVRAVAPAAEVATAARQLRRELLQAYGVVIAPTAAPSFETGRGLYARDCAACHGRTGLGDGPSARGLEPAPRSFADAEVMADLSPARAFSALTDGLDGTAMPSFALLPASDRWSLAFYLLTLRHDPQSAARGRSVYQGSARPMVTTLTRLAGESDDEIVAELGRAGVDGAAGADLLAYLRLLAPYESRGAPLDLARVRLAASLVAYRAGDRRLAKQEANAAYLDGFEPHEVALRAAEAASVVRIEQAFLGLRQAIDEGSDAGDLEQHVLRVTALLDAAEERMSGSGGAKLAFIGAFAIVIREGLEGALLVMLILGWARRAGAERLERRVVHHGWLAAVGMGLVTWFLSGSLLARIGGTHRELVEGIVSLIAAGVLLGASHFVLARLDAQRRIQALKRKLETAASKSRRWLVLATLAFVAVYREAFEVVLFLRALLLDAGGSAAAVAAGVASASVLLVLLVATLGRVGRHLRPALWLTATGTMLCVLAVVLAGKGVRSLQEAGYVSIELLSLPRLDGIGLYPTVETTGAQVAVLILFAAIAIAQSVRTRKRTVRTRPST